MAISLTTAEIGEKKNNPKTTAVGFLMASALPGDPEGTKGRAHTYTKANKDINMHMSTYTHT